MRTTPEDRERLTRLAEKNDALSIYAMLTREDLANLLQDLAEAERERDHMNEQAAAFALRAREMDEENKRLREELDAAVDADGLRGGRSVLLRCRVNAIRVMGRDTVAIEMPLGHCCDMTGATVAAASLLEGVTTILTFSGGRPDTTYRKVGSTWEAHA